MRAAALVNDLHGLFHGEALLIAPAGHQRVEHIGHGHDAGGKRNFLALQALGVAHAVPFFVVVQRQVLGFLQEPFVALGHHINGAGDDLAAGDGVLLDLVIFLVRQPSRLVQHGIGHVDFTHVVQRR